MCNFANEMTQAKYTYQIISKNQEDLFVDQDGESHSIQTMKEWMRILQINPELNQKQAHLNFSNDWSTLVHPWTQTQILEMTTWIATQNKIFVQNKSHNTALAYMDGTEEQKLAYDIIMKHYNDLTSQLLIKMPGTAGLWKSWLLHVLQQTLPEQNAKFTAITGVAAILINGSTVHSLLRLPTRAWQYVPLNGQTLRSLQEQWAQNTESAKPVFLFIDEISMLGHRKFYWLDIRAREATGNGKKPFGGLSVIITGDFGQLPPVLDKAICSEPTAVVLKHLWRRCCLSSLTQSWCWKETSALTMVRVQTCFLRLFYVCATEKQPVPTTIFLTLECDRRYPRQRSEPSTTVSICSLKNCERNTTIFVSWLH